MLTILLSLLLQPALTEDSCQPSVHVCFWDAAHRGNEWGHPVIIIQ